MVPIWAAAAGIGALAVLCAAVLGVAALLRGVRGDHS
jgi:hypothetical protein